MNKNPDDRLKQAAAGRKAGGGSQAQSSLDKASEDLLRKVPPQSLEAEQAVLGGIFVNREIYYHIVDIVSKDDFYFPAHRLIFDCFNELSRTSKPIDLVTVAEYLKSSGDLDKIGGPLYLAELRESSLVNAANADYHAQIVREKAIRRELIGASTEVIGNCFDASRSVQEVLDETESAVFAISERSTGTVYKSSKQLVDKVFKDLESRADRNELVTGVPTGYHKLNEMTAGFQPSDLIIMAGRPSMGKTAFAMNVAMRTAVMDQTPTLIYSLEMSMDQIMQRMLCSWGKVDLGKLRRGYLNDDDWARLYDAADALASAPIFVDDTPALTTMEIRARTRRLKMEKDLGFVVVDYLQLMRTSRRTDSREQEISDISRNLKAMAKELSIPVVALSQLNRKLEERTNKRPMLSDLRESGAIEQDADLIIFIYRDEVYNKRDDNPKKGIADIIIGKQRNGPTGDVELAFLNFCTAFEELYDRPAPSEEGVDAPS